MLALGGFDESIGGGAEDINLWMRMILSGSRAGLVDEPLGTYRLRAGSPSDRYVDHLRWTVTSIEAATAPIRDQLSRDERETLDWRLGVLRHDAALAGLEQALLSNGPRRRRRAASVAIGRGFSARTRARALAAAAAPALPRGRSDAATSIGAGRDSPADAATLGPAPVHRPDRQLEPEPLGRAELRVDAIEEHRIVA